MTVFTLFPGLGFTYFKSHYTNSLIDENNLQLNIVELFSWLDLESGYGSHESRAIRKGWGKSEA